jgi:aspartyl-tRNA(Asn)/glutamyl-tRNA(Gln) amidotransferase subunit C
MGRMPSISRAEVAHLASLARIDLDDAHLDRLVVELDVILAAVATVTEIATDDIPPTSHPLPLTNVFRPDIVRPGLTHEQAMSAAPAVESGRFRVPRILDDEPPAEAGA